MDFRDLQRHWDVFGRTDPFWAILTDPSRRGNRWDLAEFFDTGRQEVAALIEHAARLGVPRLRRRAMDFGCGAGRLTQALAAYVDEVVGVDVAPSMIELAARHNAYDSRCQYVLNDRDDLSRWQDHSFDIVYTGRVLQHMEPRYAENYIREFVRVLAPGGYLSFDVPSEAGVFPAEGPPGAAAASAYRAHVRMLDAPDVMPPGVQATIHVEATNIGLHTWQEPALNVGNRWLADEGSVVVPDDGRTPLRLPWAPGECVRVELRVTAPPVAGTYRLQCDVVHEGVTWFQHLGSTPAESAVDVGGPSAAPRTVGPVASAAEEEPRMEMHAVPRERVEEILAAAAARVLDVRRVEHCGINWLAFRYDCTRR